MSRRNATAPTHRMSDSRLACWTNWVKNRLLSSIPSVRTIPSSNAYEGAFGSTRSTMVWTRRVRDQEPPDLDEAKLQPFRLLEISPHRGLIPGGG